MTVDQDLPVHETRPEAVTEPPLRVVIAAGGTAGHVVPALAVADILRASGAEVVFVGGRRAEAELVPAAGFGLRRLDVEGISRSNPLQALRAVVKAVVACFGAIRVLREEKADAVLGGGGYVAGPVGLAALLLRVPLVLTEADSHLGLTNRLLARGARRVCLAFPIEGRTGSKYQVAGRPVPPMATDRKQARERFGIGESEECVLIFGGSLGARSLNFAAIEAFADTPFRVLHVAGKRDFPSLTAPGPHYLLKEYVPEFGEALLASDLVIARAGGSVFEIAQYGKPSLLIPYPHATADHQTANAQWLEKAGAAVVMRDDDLSAAGLRRAVSDLLTDPKTLTEMADAATTWSRPDAGTAVAQEILACAERALPAGSKKN